MHVWYIFLYILGSFAGKNVGIHNIPVPWMHNGKCYSPKTNRTMEKKQPFESMYLPKNRTGDVPA